MRAVIPLTRDPMSFLAAMSTSARVYEEYPVASYTILASKPVSQDQVRALRSILGKMVGQGNVDVKYIDARPERLVGESEDSLVFESLKILEETAASGESVVVSVSPAGWRLAAALAIAGVRGGAGRSYDVIHVHFYFGAWRGLPYPYTPRRLEPLIVMHKAEGPGETPRNAAMLRYAAELSWSEESTCTPRIPGTRPLPPLRCAVAETARRLNDVEGARALLPGSLGPCGRISVAIGDRSVAEAELCDEKSVARAAGKIAMLLNELAESFDSKGSPLAQAVAWTGLAALEVWSPEGPRGPLPEASAEPGLVADTSLLYYGIHVYAWGGIPVGIPECAEIEVERAWSHALKHGRIETPRDAASMLAYLAFLEVKGAGGRTIPTPPVPCDIALPKADPVTLEGLHPATADDGAFRYWRRHPNLRGATILKVSFDPIRAERPFEGLENPERLSRLYYGLVQSLLLLELLSRQGLLEKGLGGRVSLKIKRPDGSETPFKAPVHIIEKALGLKPSQAR